METAAWLAGCKDSLACEQLQPRRGYHWRRRNSVLSEMLPSLQSKTREVPDEARLRSSCRVPARERREVQQLRGGASVNPATAAFLEGARMVCTVPVPTAAHLNERCGNVGSIAERRAGGSCRRFQHCLGL